MGLASGLTPVLRVDWAAWLSMLLGGVADANKVWDPRGSCGKFYRSWTSGFLGGGGAWWLRRLQPQRFPGQVSGRSLWRQDGSLNSHRNVSCLWCGGLDTSLLTPTPRPDSAGRKMAHCSSCCDAGNHHRAPPPDLAAPGEEGQHPIPAAATASTPRGRVGARGSHFHGTLSSGLRGARFSLGNSEARDWAKVGHGETPGRGFKTLSCCLIESILRASGNSTGCTCQLVT